MTVSFPFKDNFLLDYCFRRVSIIFNIGLTFSSSEQNPKPYILHRCQLHTNKLYVLIECFIINALSTIQLDNIYMEYKLTYIYSGIQPTYTLSYSSHFSADTAYFMHTHIHACVGVVNGPSRLFPLNNSSFVVYAISTW